MADRNITSADAVFMISVPGLYPTPVKLQGFSTDRATAMDGVDIAETMMGVDGHMSAGYTPNIFVQTVTLQADSTSRAIFDTIYRASQANRTVYYMQGTLDYPSLQESFVMTRGVLKNYKPIPDAAKVLQAVDFQIHWERFDPTVS